MKYTLLELVQLVLRSIKGELVNSLADTEESVMVAEIIKEAYFNIISTVDLPELITLFELNASGDPAKPVLMSVPSYISAVTKIEYDIATEESPEVNFQEINYVPLADFRHMTNQLNTSETNVGTMTISLNDGDSITFKYRNDKAPSWWTYVEDETVLFDSFDLDVDTTLQKNKTTAYGLKSPEWEQEDLFVPTLDASQFDLLIQESKALAWYELRQMPHEKAEKKARKGWAGIDKRKYRADRSQINSYYNKLPNYGRTV